MADQWMAGFTAKHTGLLSIVPEPSPEGAASYPVHVTSDNDRVLIWHPQDRSAVSDPLAPIGIPTTYTQSGLPPVTFTRRSTGSDIISDWSGHVRARVDLMPSSSYTYEGGLATVTASTGVVDRWSAVSAPRATTIECRTKTLDDFRALRDLVEMAGYLIVAHDTERCRIPGCTIEPIRVVAVSKATGEQTEARARGTVEWQLSVTERSKRKIYTDAEHAGWTYGASYAKAGVSLGTFSPCVTWGEWMQFEKDVHDGKVAQRLTYLWGGPDKPEDDKAIGGDRSENWSPHGRPTRGGGVRNVTPTAGVRSFRQSQPGHRIHLSVYARRITQDKYGLSNVSVGLWCSDGFGGASKNRAFVYDASSVTKSLPDDNGWVFIQGDVVVPDGKPWIAPYILLDGADVPLTEFGELTMADMDAQQGSTLQTRTYHDVCVLLAGQGDRK